MTRNRLGIAALVAVIAVVVWQIIWLIVIHIRVGTPLRPFFGEPIVPERAAPSIHLEDDRGKPFAYVPGAADAPTAFYFGYTHCTDACPLALARLTRAHRAFPALRVVFVTIDPARDDWVTIHRYLTRFDSSFIGLTGKREQIAAVQRAFGVSSAPSGTDRQIAHDDAVLVVDRRGRLALRYRGADLDVSAFVDDVGRLQRSR